MATTTTAAPPKVGDFFYTSWGYDQTNVDFYQVVGVTPSGKSVKIRRVRKTRQSTGLTSDAVAPVKDGFFDPESPSRYERERAQTLTKRLRWSPYGNEWLLTIESYAHASPWDGQPKYETASGFGH